MCLDAEVEVVVGRVFGEGDVDGEIVGGFGCTRSKPVDRWR